MKKWIAFSIHFLLFIIVYKASLGQQTAIYTMPDKTFRQGVELLEKQQFAAAKQKFDALLTHRQQPQKSLIIEAEFYSAACGIELFHAGANFEMQQFISAYPEHPKAQQAAFYLGKYYFRNKQYKEAKEWLEKVQAIALSNDEAIEYYFKTAYTYFSLNDLGRAARAFQEVKNTKSKYSAAATYYLAHIEYQQGKYDSALKLFEQVKENKAFASIVPYYLAQILHQQKRYDEAIAYAAPLLEKAKADNAKELNHILGDSYFKKGDYTAAYGYLKNYAEAAGDKLSRADNYEIGYCQYLEKNYAEAIPNLEKAADIAKDSLSQYSLHILGECYLRQEQKPEARNAFLLASKLNFNQSLKEDALINYAKVCVELNLQSEAVETLQNFVKAYPKSSNLDEANGLLAELFMTTKNYKDALASLENIKNKNERNKKAFQKIAYYRGVELYNETKLAAAGELFDKSLQFPFNSRLAALAKYWKGEVFYRQGNYNAAIKMYSDFTQTPMASTVDEYPASAYNMGYAFFKKEDYAQAVNGFKRYLEFGTDTDPLRFNDAMMRIADSYFMLRDFEGALKYYDKAVRNGAPAADYAMFQMAKIQGIQNAYKEKIATLENLVQRYPNSPYVDDALYESGAAYGLMGEDLQAINYYNDVASRYPNSSYTKKSLLAMALIYFNAQRDGEAIKTYKQVVQDYPNTAEAKEALVGLKNIYASEDKAEEYLEYAKGISFSGVTQAASDSISYEAAEQRYMKNECETGFNDFSNYLNKFPNGNFIINAHFYRAECLYKNKQYDQALSDYDAVLSRRKNTFTEKSLQHAAYIAMQLKDFQKAYEYYLRLEEEAEYSPNILEAQIGQMRAGFQLKKFDAAGASSIKVILNNKASEATKSEAHLTYGKSLVQMDSSAMAFREFLIVAKAINTERGAEAKYLIAKMYYDQKRYKESEKVLSELSNQASSDFWIAKGYILLADNYLRQGNTFQAKATLQSIIENYEGEDLKTEARQALLNIEKMEAPKSDASTDSRPDLPALENTKP